MLVQKIQLTGKVFLCEDSNEHVGQYKSGYESVYGGLNFGNKNNIGVTVLDFALGNNFRVVNSICKKHEHLATF